MSSQTAEMKPVVTWRCTQCDQDGSTPSSQAAYEALARHSSGLHDGVLGRIIATPEAPSDDPTRRATPTDDAPTPSSGTASQVPSGTASQAAPAITDVDTPTATPTESHGEDEPVVAVGDQQHERQSEWQSEPGQALQAPQEPQASPVTASTETAQPDASAWPAVAPLGQGATTPAAPKRSASTPAQAAPEPASTNGGWPTVAALGQGRAPHDPTPDPRSDPSGAESDTSSILADALAAEATVQAVTSDPFADTPGDVVTKTVPDDPSWIAPAAGDDRFAPVDFTDDDLPDDEPYDDPFVSAPQDTYADAPDPGDPSWPSNQTATPAAPVTEPVTGPATGPFSPDQAADLSRAGTTVPGWTAPVQEPAPTRKPVALADPFADPFAVPGRG